MKRKTFKPSETRIYVAKSGRVQERILGARYVIPYRAGYATAYNLPYGKSQVLVVHDTPEITRPTAEALWIQGLQDGLSDFHDNVPPPSGPEAFIKE